MNPFSALSPDRVKSKYDYKFCTQIERILSVNADIHGFYI